MSTSTCSTYKSLTIDFTTPDIPPVNGYIVKWRTVGDANWNTVSPNPMNSPVIIGNVPACGNIEGTIQADCGNGSTGSSVSFLAPGIGYASSYTFTNNGCSNSITNLTLNGVAGDTVLLELDVSGYITADGTGSTTYTAGYGFIINVASLSSTAKSTTITTGSSTVNGSTTLTFTMPTNSVTVTTTVTLNNATTSASSAVLKLVSVNGTATNANVSLCYGTSSGSW